MLNVEDRRLHWASDWSFKKTHRLAAGISIMAAVATCLPQTVIETMKLRKPLTFVAILSAALLLGTSARVQAQERAGTSSSPQLLIPVGAQYLDGSGAAAGISGIGSVMWNPAGLAKRDGDIMVMLSRREHLADVGVNFLAVGVGFENIGAFSLHLRNFSIGEIKETTESNPGGTGATFTPSYFTFGASYGRALTDQIRVGVTANLNRESFGSMSATGFTFDAGVQYSQFLNFSGLDLGVSIRHIGQAMEYTGSGLQTRAQSIGADRSTTQFQTVAADADIPTTVDVSLEYNVWKGFNVATTYSENTYQPAQVQTQLSYNFRDLVTLRGSYSQLLEDRGELESPYENRPSFGGTVNLASVLDVNLSFDYAFVSTKFFENNHILSLRGTF